MPIRKRITDRKPTLQEIVDMPFTVGQNAKWKHYSIGATESEVLRGKFQDWWSQATSNKLSQHPKVDAFLTEIDCLFDDTLKSMENLEYRIEDLEGYE